MSVEKLCDQDREMIESVLVENEEYHDSLHNDAERVFTAATDLRVARFTWQYENGKAKVKSSKSYTYDNIRRAVSKTDRASNELHVLVELLSNEVIELLKMPEHFTKEVNEYIARISEEAAAFRAGGVVKQGSNIQAILNNLDDLVKLAQLRQMGVIGEDEFQEAKAILVRRG